MKAFFFLSALIVAFAFSLANASTEETCKNATGSEEAYRLCVSCLHAAPGSQIIDNAANLTQQLETSFTDIVEMLKALIGSIPSLPPKVKEALGLCLDDYVTGIVKLASAINKIKNGNIFGAVGDLAEAAKAPIKCKEAFDKAQSPLIKERVDATKLKDDVLKIISILCQ